METAPLWSLKWTKYIVIHLPPFRSLVLSCTAHPKAKLFLTHGGSHGIYESICNAVPMVMMPLFGDQPDNTDLMVSRGVAARVSVFDVTTEKLLEGLNKVLNDTRYGRTLKGTYYAKLTFSLLLYVYLRIRSASPPLKRKFRQLSQCFVICRVKKWVCKRAV